MNFSINARDAMPDGGRLEIQTQNVELSAGDVDGRINAGSNNYVLLTVSDSGCGMTEEVKLSIFEPFFSTKPTGEGTGLGLAIAHSIVSRSGGGIQVSSEIGIGTTFRIFFPPCSAEKEKTRDSSHSPANASGQRTDTS